LITIWIAYVWKRSSRLSLPSLFATLSEEQNLSPFFSTICALFAQNCRGVPPLFFAPKARVAQTARSLAARGNSSPYFSMPSGLFARNAGVWHPGRLYGNISPRKCVDSGGWTNHGKGCLVNRIAKALRVGLSLLGLAAFGSMAGAQDVPPLEKIQSQAELDKAITTLDAGLFNAYNKCDLEKFATYFTENVEFYHDQGGLTLGRAALTESVKKNICGKVTRELVPGTLQVFHMKGYGAIEMGVHRFHHPGHEDTEGVGEGRFVHLWQYKDGAWKITRVLSYDHHAAPK